VPNFDYLPLKTSKIESGTADMFKIKIGVRSQVKYWDNFCKCIKRHSCKNVIQPQGKSNGGLVVFAKITTTHILVISRLIEIDEIDDIDTKP